MSLRKFSKSLQILIKLHNNKISKLDYSVIRYLKKPNIPLTNILLFDNLWECNCDAEKLIQIPSINNSLNVGKMRCKNDDALLLKVNFTEKCTFKYSLSDIEMICNMKL